MDWISRGTSCDVIIRSHKTHPSLYYIAFYEFNILKDDQPLAITWFKMIKLKYN